MFSSFRERRSTAAAAAATPGSDTQQKQHSQPGPYSAAPRATVPSVWERVGSVVTPMWRKVGDAVSPRVVQPAESVRNRSAYGVIPTMHLTQYERVRLNAMEERVLPADVRIKIVFAQANAGEREEEIEADVKTLDGLVRTLALYGVLERNSIDSSKSDKLASDRERELGKMLVAAVQLELFQMLDDICEAGDVENDLFDDLCSDAIQEGRRAGFFHLSPELLLAPGSGYKRLLQIRKDQIVEDIADAAGLRAFAGHDCQRELSPSVSPKSVGATTRINGDGRINGDAAGAMDSDCGSPGSTSGGVAFPVLNIGGSASTNAGGLGPSPSSHRPDSGSPSPEGGSHRRSQTQRVRDLLSSIDGLVMESEQTEPEEALANLPPLSPEDLRHDTGSARSGRNGYSVRSKRQSTGGIAGGSGVRASRRSLRTPPRPDEDEAGTGDGRSPADRAFFPHEAGWRVPYASSTPPAKLASGGSSAVPTSADAAGEGGVASADMLLAEVDWLIAGTNAALGDDPALGDSSPELSPTSKKIRARQDSDAGSQNGDATGVAVAVAAAASSSPSAIADGLEQEARLAAFDRSDNTSDTRGRGERGRERPEAGGAGSGARYPIEGAEVLRGVPLPRPLTSSWSLSREAQVTDVSLETSPSPQARASGTTRPEDEDEPPRPRPRPSSRPQAGPDASRLAGTEGYTDMDANAVSPEEAGKRTAPPLEKEEEEGGEEEEDSCAPEAEVETPVFGDVVGAADARERLDDDGREGPATTRAAMSAVEGRAAAVDAARIQEEGEKGEASTEPPPPAATIAPGAVVVVEDGAAAPDAGKNGDVFAGHGVTAAGVKSQDSGWEGEGEEAARPVVGGENGVVLGGGVVRQRDHSGGISVLSGSESELSGGMGVSEAAAATAAVDVAAALEVAVGGGVGSNGSGGYSSPVFLAKAPLFGVNGNGAGVDEAGGALLEDVEL